MNKLFKVFWVICYILMVAIAGWVCISYIDIIWDNYLPNPQHFDWNFFVLLTDAR